MSIFRSFSCHICNTNGGCWDPCRKFATTMATWRNGFSSLLVHYFPCKPENCTHRISQRSLSSKCFKLSFTLGSQFFLVFSQLQTKVKPRLSHESLLKGRLQIRRVQWKVHKNNQLCRFLSQEMYKAKRVCVIGAGPSGMSALYQFKQLEMKGQEIPEIVCFEKQSDWGGLWNYSWRTGRGLFCCTCINENFILAR